MNKAGSFTKPITTAITINDSDNVVSFTLIVESGTCEVLGSGKFQGGSSSPITLTAGQSFTKMAPAGFVLDGYTITPSGGTTNIEISQF